MMAQDGYLDDITKCDLFSAACHVIVNLKKKLKGWSRKFYAHSVQRQVTSCKF